MCSVSIQLKSSATGEFFCKYDCKLLIFRSSGNQNYQSFRGGANIVKKFQGDEGSPRGGGGRYVAESVLTLNPNKMKASTSPESSWWLIRYFISDGVCLG